MISRHWRLTVMTTIVVATLALGTAGISAQQGDQRKDADHRDGHQEDKKDDNVQQIFNDKTGGLPLSNSFTSNGGTLVIFASGSGWSSSGGYSIGMGILIDGTQFGTARVLTNEGGSHKAFVSNALVVTGVGVGTHTLELLPLPGTNTDINDFYSVTVMAVKP